MSIKIKPPPSKSVSHRAAICASLASGRSEVQNLLESEDLNRTLDCLQSLGTQLEKQGSSVLFPNKQTWPGEKQAQRSLDVGESGTTCRLLTAIAALSPDPCKIQGAGRMHQRPIQELANTLKDQGSRFKWLGEPGYPPFILYPGGLHGGELSIALEQSSQYLSGLLLAAPLAKNDCQINIGGEKAVSWPYVAITLKVMQEFGAELKIQTQAQAGDWQEEGLSGIARAEPGKVRFVVKPKRYQGRSYTVEGDWSNSSYFLAAGVLHPEGTTLLGLDPNSAQGDKEILNLLKKMGASPKWTEQGLEITPASLMGISADMGACPDLVPTVAVLASLAKGRTTIYNVAHLRLKESDRLQALANEISKTKTLVSLSEDKLVIDPATALDKSQRIHFKTYQDHRLAMSLSLYELAGLDLDLDHPECVKKSFPSFWESWEKLKTGHLTAT